jgi:hypothetical protein
MALRSRTPTQRWGATPCSLHRIAAPGQSPLCAASQTVVGEGQKCQRERVGDLGLRTRGSPRRTVGISRSRGLSVPFGRVKLRTMNWLRTGLPANAMLAGIWALVACGGDNISLHTVQDNRVVTTPGGSCGVWTETKSDPPTSITVTATCGDGMSCAGVAYFISEPADHNGRAFRTCLPPNALTCDLSDNPCPDLFECVEGFGLPGTGACIHTCTKHTDCPDSYQLCDSGSCTVLFCETPTDASPGRACWEGTHCQDRICRPD